MVVGIKNSFEHERMIHHMRVIYVEGRPEICVRDKEEDTVYNMFYTRYDLHRKGKLLHVYIYGLNL